MKNKIAINCLAISLLFSIEAKAAEIDMNMAEMQAMDKITGRVSIINVPVDGAVQFGSFSIVVRSCKTRTEEETPENFAFVDVTDKSFDQEEYNIFKGWMLSSSPAVNAVEHPIYDVWLLRCFNGEVKKNLLLSENELAARDNLPRLSEVKDRNESLNQNTFIEENPKNIVFKDSMYKEQNLAPEISVLDPKIDGEPQNLLNIQDSYEEEFETFVEVPSEDFEKAIQQEASSLKKLEQEALEKVETQDYLNEDLAAEIDAELKKAK